MKSILLFFCIWLYLPASAELSVQQYPPWKICNDSASYFLENGHEKKADQWITRALHNSPNDDRKEYARTHLLAGDLNDMRGYSRKAVDNYRLAISSHQDPFQRSRAFTGIANALVTLGRYDSVEFYTNNSVTLDSSLRNKTLNEIVLAKSWQTQNISERSIHYWQLAHEHGRQLQDNRLQAIALSGMASALFSHDPDMKRVRQYLDQANALCDSSRDANILARNYARMANVFMVLGNLGEAEKYLLRAKAIANIAENLPVRAYVLSSFAILRAEQGDINGALAFSQEPLAIKRELGQLRPLQNDLLNISEWYTDLRKFDQAREILKEGIATSSRLGDVVYLHYFYERVARVDSLAGNYREALANLKQAMFYKDSAQSLKRFRAVEEVREKYEAEQKQLIIEEKEIIIQRQRLQQLVILAGAVVVILMSVIGLIALRNRHRRRIQLEKDQQRQLQLQTIVHTQEEVQQSIARDIHDGLVQVLGAAKMSLESVSRESDKGVLFSRMGEASRIIDEACLEARNISHQILPYCLLKGGLEPAIEELLSKSLANYEFIRVNSAGRLSDDIEINVYRIAQELVTNVVKHAEANHVTMRLSIEHGNLTLECIDDGKGFDTAQSRSGVGITNIHTRAELIHARVVVDSALGKGTRIRIIVPL